MCGEGERQGGVDGGEEGKSERKKIKSKISCHLWSCDLNKSSGVTHLLLFNKLLP